MNDTVFAGFLARQREEGLAVAAASDLLDLVPLDGTLSQRYLAEFRCTGLIRAESGEIVEVDRFLVGVCFPDGYLREADPYQVLSCLEPRRVFHPNVLAPFICIGHLAPGTSLVDLLYRCFEVLAYQRATLDNALNEEAAAWARRNQHRFPVDRRPLKWRATELGIGAAGRS